jgi:tetratricopeptide (TPR) repeat protein/DNA-binding CsgD family transcriptional regulator
MLLLTACHSPAKHDENKFNEKLAMADSISHFNPETADSIYRFLISRQDLKQSPVYTKAMIGLSTVFSERGVIDTARLYLDSAFAHARLLHDTLSLLRALLQSGNLNLDPGNFDLAETDFIAGLNLAKKAKSTAWQEKFLLSLASIQSEHGNYSGAIKTYMLGLKMAENQKNKVSEAFALEQIGVTLSRTNEFKDAISYLKRAITLRKEMNMSREYASALQNLGVVYRRANNPDSSMFYYNQAYKIFEQLQDSVNMIMVRYNIGVVLKNEKKYGLALKEMNAVLATCTQKNIFQGQVYAYTTLAAIYQQTGDLEKALACVDSAIHLAGKINQQSNLPSFYDRKVEILASMGNYKAAYENMRQLNIIQDSLFSEEKQKEVARLKTNYETEKRELRIRFLQTDNEYQATRLNLLKLAILLGSAVLVLIIALFLFRLKRVRLQNHLAEERNLRMQEEQKVKQAEMEQLELKNQLQEQELVYKTLVQSDLVQLNRSVREKMSPFRMKIPRKSDQDEFSMTLHELSRDSHHDPMAEFELLFRQLHPAFYENLLNQCPSLSVSELQICALIRLNFSSKDIARLISLSVATVETTRSHIRKKLNLEGKDNLSTLLMAI